MMFQFSMMPTTDDFQQLARHIEKAGKDSLHPALWQMRHTVMAHLLKMAERPEAVRHRSIYNALRLLVW